MMPGTSGLRPRQILKKLGRNVEIPKSKEKVRCVTSHTFISLPLLEYCLAINFLNSRSMKYAVICLAYGFYLLSKKHPWIYLRINFSDIKTNGYETPILLKLCNFSEFWLNKMLTRKFPNIFWCHISKENKRGQKWRKTAKSFCKTSPTHERALVESLFHLTWGTKKGNGIYLMFRCTISF